MTKTLLTTALLALTVACSGGDDKSDTETTDDTEVSSDTEASDTETSDTETESDLVNGEAVWSGTCANDYCHGSNTTVQDRAPSMSESELYDQITLGGGYMPAQSDLDEDQIRDVMAYIWSEFGGPS